MPTAVLRAAALLGLAALALPGCAGDDGAATLRVSAAASLTGVFSALATEFEDRHPSVEVELNFGPSSVLVQQAMDGAPADVLVTADEATMADAAAASLVGPSRVVARNHLTLAVERGNPEGVDGVEDLRRRPDLVVVACAERVPCGRLAVQMFAAAGGKIEADSLEEDVKAVASRVALGEADVGVVYATDVHADDRLDAVDPGGAAHRLVAGYPAAVVTTSDRRPSAEAWVDFLVSEDGLAVFEAHGFAAP